VSLSRANIRSIAGVFPRSGTRPKRVSHRELIRVERSRRKRDALLLAFSASMADRRPRPLRTSTRKQYVFTVKRAMLMCEEADKSLLAADERTVRFVCGRMPPSSSSQNAMLNALHAFYEFLVDQGVRKDNPVEKIRRPPRPNYTPRPLSVEDCCKYLDVAFQLGPKHYAIGTLGTYAGMRSSEVRRSRWVDFFTADGRMWCDVDGKGGRRRRQYIHSAVVVALRSLRESHDHATWLFPSPVAARADEPVSTSTMRQWHLETLEEAKLGRHYTFHQLRHSFATYLRRAGGDLAIVQKGLGHSSPTTSMVYMDVLDDELAEAVERLDFRRTKTTTSGEGVVVQEEEGQYGVLP
jgi:integrase/recombinase XerD